MDGGDPTDGSAGAPEPEPEPEPEPDQCTDSNRNCASWASRGECSRNPGYMLTNCCASCAGR